MRKEDRNKGRLFAGGKCVYAEVPCWHIQARTELGGGMDAKLNTLRNLEGRHYVMSKATSRNIDEF